MKELTENYLAKSWLNGFLESSWVKRLLTLKLHMRYEDWSQKVTKEVANPRIQPTALRAADKLCQVHLSTEARRQARGSDG